MKSKSVLDRFNKKYKTEGSYKNAPVVQGIFDPQKSRKGHILYTPCQPVTSKDQPFLGDFVKIMYHTMLKENGIGLAANQIGIGLQIFIMEIKNPKESVRYPDLENVPFTLVINPVITQASEDLSSFWHGCLSARGQEYGKLSTYKSLKYSALDISLQPVQGEVSEMSAIIFQHEFRHLLGSLYIDQTDQFLSDEEEQKLDSFSSTENQEIQPPHILSDYKIGSLIHEHLQNKN